MKLLVCTQVVDKNHPILGFFHGWLLEFSKHFDEVHVICLEKGTHELPSHVILHSLGKEHGESNLKYTVRFYRYFIPLFFKNRVDFVFFHMGYIFNVLAIPFFPLRHFFGTKFYWWKTHGTLTLLGRVALVACDAVYTAAVESFPVHTAKKRAVGHAIGIVDVPLADSIKTEPPTLLFIGRVTPVKNIQLVIETAEVLHSRGVICNVRIVGAFADPAYEEVIRARIATSKIASHITLVGPRPYQELKEEYTQTTVVMNPSETGGIDKVVLESMMYGVPAVALKKTYGSLLDPFGLSVAKQEAVHYADTLEPFLRNGVPLSFAESLKQEVLTRHNLATLCKRVFPNI